MRRLLPVFALLAAIRPAAAVDDFPQVELKTDRLKLTVYLPDAGKGYYRGTRFDWAGILGNVEFHGHKLFAYWKDKHDPANFEDALGPVEEFGTESPLGYDEAKIGETFLKIGVGELVKPKNEKYSPHNNYKIAKPGTWTVEKNENVVSFAQEIKAANGFGYRYRKVVSVGPGPELRIAHTFTNVGTQPIESNVYNHNFLNVDGDPVGPNYRFEFPFPTATDDPRERFREVVELAGRDFRFSKPLDHGTVWANLTGFDEKTLPGFIFRHTPSKVRLTVTGRFPSPSVVPVSRVNFWAIKTAACPEPFSTIRVKPGEEASWGWEYRFETE